MRKVIEYKTLNERQNIIDEHSHLFLIEEQNITEGNFLIFSDEPTSEKTIYTQVPKEEFEDIEIRTTASENAILALILGGL